MSAHPLAGMLADAARGSFPPFDGLVEVLPSPGPPVDALVAFTGHFVLAADVDAAEVAARMPPGELRVPFSPAGAVVVGRTVAARTVDARRAARLDRGRFRRAAVAASRRRLRAPAGRRGIALSHGRGVWTDDVGSLLIIGRGLCGRSEVGYEVAPGERGAGLGRRLVAAARGLVPAGEPLWAQVAPGNAASMRSTLAAGFVPVGAEVLFARGSELPY